MAGFKLRDRRILKLEIALGLGWARFLVRFVPFRWWSGTLGTLDTAVATSAPALAPDQAAKAVGVGKMVRKIAARMPFEAVCLPQAMCARWMLARRGIPTRVVIGSRRDLSQQDLAFHAWLMAGDQIVTGGDESEEFAAFGSRQIARD